MAGAAPSDTEVLLQRAGAGDPQALADAFARYRDRLRRMVRLRMDRRLQGRIDPSEILNEAYFDAAREADEYLAHPSLPFYLWLRSLTGRRLMMVERQRLGKDRTGPGQEVSLYCGALPTARTHSLAAQLLGRLSSESQADRRAEMQFRLQELLNTMDAIDRELLALRHFEELSNNDAAIVLGLESSAASNRYVRALKHLREMMSALAGFSHN